MRCGACQTGVSSTEVSSILLNFMSVQFCLLARSLQQEDTQWQPRCNSFITLDVNKRAWVQLNLLQKTGCCNLAKFPLLLSAVCTSNICSSCVHCCLDVYTLVAFKRDGLSVKTDMMIRGNTQEDMSHLEQKERWYFRNVGSYILKYGTSNSSEPEYSYSFNLLKPSGNFTYHQV
jgi:hypothetical protein